MNPADQSPQELADLFCREARRRIEGNFRAVKSNFNRSYGKVAGLLMDGKLDWLAEGSINPIPPQYRDWEKNDYEHPAASVGQAQAGGAEGSCVESRGHSPLADCPPGTSPGDGPRKGECPLSST